MIAADGLPESLGNGALPIVLAGVGGIFAWHLIPGRLATTRLLVQIAVFGLMSALLVAGSVVPYTMTAGVSAAALLTGAAKALWWLHLAWALIGFVRLYLVIEHSPREARLLQDIVVGIVYLGMILSVLAFVLGAPVGTLIATSGVLAIVLGLALQSTLGDLFSGIALNIGRSYAIGDWIRLEDGAEGRVVETNWQSTHLLTSTHNLVALPNSMLAKRALTNFSRPDETHALVLCVRFVPTVTPQTVAAVMRTALCNADLVIQEPPPSVSITRIDAAAIELELAFRVPDINSRTAARNAVIDLVYRHAWSEALSLAAPVAGSIAACQVLADGVAAEHHPRLRQLLDVMPAFRLLGDDDRAKLAARASMQILLDGEIVVNSGDSLGSLMVVGSGVIRRLRDFAGQAAVTGHLAPGDVFGRSGKDGEKETLRARGRAILYEISREAVEVVAKERPDWGADLTAMLERRETVHADEHHMRDADPPPRHRLLKVAKGVFRRGRSRSD